MQTVRKLMDGEYLLMLKEDEQSKDGALVDLVRNIFFVLVKYFLHCNISLLIITVKRVLKNILLYRWRSWWYKERRGRCQHKAFRQR